jgi:hypothetical protein
MYALSSLGDVQPRIGDGDEITQLGQGHVGDLYRYIRI